MRQLEGGARPPGFDQFFHGVSNIVLRAIPARRDFLPVSCAQPRARVLGNLPGQVVKWSCKQDRHRRIGAFPSDEGTQYIEPAIFRFSQRAADDRGLCALYRLAVYNLLERILKLLGICQRPRQKPTDIVLSLTHFGQAKSEEPTSELTSL